MLGVVYGYIIVKQNYYHALFCGFAEPACWCWSDGDPAIRDRMSRDIGNCGPRRCSGCGADRAVRRARFLLWWQGVVGGCGRRACGSRDRLPSCAPGWSHLLPRQSRPGQSWNAPLGDAPWMNGSKST